MNTWKKVKIQDVTTVLGDGLHGTPKYTEDGEYAFVNGNNLVNGKLIIKKDTKRVDETQYEKYKKPLDERTIMVSINGTLGNVGVYNGEKVILGKSACYFNVKEEYDKEFIKYVVSSPVFKNYLENNATGTTIKNISLKQMREYEFDVPSYELQRKISRILKNIDDKIETNQAINRNLLDQAEAYFNELFVENAYEEWEEGTLSDVGTIVAGGTPSKAKEEYYCKNGIAWITPKDLSQDKSVFISHGEYDISDLGYEKSSATKMPAGTVLFSSRAPIGYIAIATNEVTTNQGFKSVVPNDNTGTAYIYFLLKQLLPTIENMASGSTFKEISGSAMKIVPTIVPDNETLKKFNDFCAPILEKIQTLELESKRLVDLRDSLLPKLMSGELDVAELKI
ncbi:MAG: EcoKI restriction-modification system protein HsdS [Firmicutes bacterium ADurb.Bin419]|nr:MAG: EcoKI restriction-modification system protein HsdS [Firmicutes bacterium ADurb.Bin419]